jgi:diketogulonate reductase-like aldo/keto reductase
VGADEARGRQVWNDAIYAGADAVRAAAEQSLRDLQTDYLDLYLVHWPVPGRHVAAYQALEPLVAAGKIRALGLSNYTIEDYEELKPHVTVPPAVNQFEINLLLFRAKTIAYFQREGLLLQSYRTLTQGKAFALPAVAELAAKHARTPAQILGRWCVQHGIVYLGKSENPARMVENAAVLDFTLDAADMARLDSLTTPDALAAHAALYRKCCVRDTALPESAARTEFTLE